MRIMVRVSPNAKKQEVIKIDESVYKVRVNPERPSDRQGSSSDGAGAKSLPQYKVKVDAKAVDGKANIRLIEILAEHFDVPFGAIRIISGATSKEKVIEVG
jgi:uncharacterized protein